MLNTVPNQKTIIINRNMPKANFLQISNEHWMKFNKKYGPYGLQLYLYIAKNKNEFSLALSPQAAENEAGIKKTSFHKYLNILMHEGFLVKRSGNTYDFYETPYNQGEIKAKGSSHDEQPNLQDEQVNLRYEQCSFPNEA